MAVKGTIQKFAKKKTSSKPGIGASGTTNFQGIIDTDEYVTALEGSTLYTTVDKMRWSDASVQAAILTCELPIRSAEWTVEPGTDDAQGEEIAEFIKSNLFEERVLKWDDTLRQILLMHPYGVMLFEVIYKIREDGKICWRKWAPRLPKTIIKWNTDKNGELENVVQRAYKNNSLQEFTIPTEKLMVFTNRQEGDNYLGTSLLRQAYKHWFFRDKYYKIDAVATERNGIGIPLITLPDGFTDDDYSDAETMAENVRGHEKAYVVKKEGWGFEFADQKSNSLKDPKEMLEHHTREILKSVLAQFVDLGGSGVGSYALAKEQVEMFLQSLDASAKKIEDIVNKEIEKLVDFNYNVQPDEYPKLTHSDLGTKDAKEMAEAIQSLMFAGAIQADKKLEIYLRSVLKLPEKDEGEEYEKPEKKTPKEPEPDTEDDKGGMTHSEKYHRSLTKAESRVKFDELRDFMDQAEFDTLKRLLSVLKLEQARLIPKFREAIAKNDFVALHKIAWELKGQYSEVLGEQIKKLFEYGKLKASYEIKKPAPMTIPGVNKVMAERAFFLASRHEKMMMEDIKGIAAVCMMDKNVSTVETLLKVEKGFKKYYTRHVKATSALVTSEEINNGRRYTFESSKDDIYGYQWSAILDGATCNYCQSMDGRVIGVEDKAFSNYKPGAVHFNCRCIWVAIMKEEESPPPFTGIPEQLRPQSVMPAWQFKDLEYPLPGSGKRKMPYGVGVFGSKKKYTGLPDDVIWRTIGGKRVPISPSTGKPVGGWESEKDTDGKIPKIAETALENWVDNNNPVDLMTTLKNKEVQNVIKENQKKLLKKHGKTIDLYRGVVEMSKEDKDEIVYDIKRRGFLSFTSDKKIAEKFTASRNHREEKGYVYKKTVRTSDILFSPGMGNYSWGGEKEYIVGIKGDKDYYID